MKKFLISLLVFGLILSVSGLAMAASTADQTVTYAVSAISEISVSSNPGALTVSAATAGSAPTLVSDASTTYNYTSNQTRKITAALNTDMPEGLTLTVALATPGTGTSAGDVTLSNVAADVVTGITAVNGSSKTITYKLSATSAAGVVTSANKTVTLSIVAP